MPLSQRWSARYAPQSASCRPVVISAEHSGRRARRSNAVVPMRPETSESVSTVPAASQQRLAALSRWENEGGALEHGNPISPLDFDGPPLTNTELVQLRVRVIALENLVMAQ